MVHHRCNVLWSPADEKTLLWCDPALAIDWPAGPSAVLSDKDAVGRTLSSFADEELPVFQG
jgi:dTDP-4-dehydrorhamnose 3,5-epimerase-like enzyme